MPRRKRSLAWLLFAAGSLSALVIGVVWSTETGWAPTGSPASPPSAQALGNQVIASSRPVVPTVTPFSVPDDGLVRQEPVKARPEPVAVTADGTPVLLQRIPLPTDVQKPHEDAAVLRVGGTARPPTVTTESSSLSVEVLGPAQFAPGETLSYEIVVTNPGPVLLARVRVEDQLPVGAKLRSADPAPEEQGDHLVWNLGNLEGHGQRRLRVEIQPGGQTELMLTPTATFTAALGLRTKLVQPPFAVTLSAPDVVKRGAMVVISIQVANHSSAPLGHVVLHDQLPAGLEHPQGRIIEADVGTLGAGETKSLHLEVVADQTGRFVNEVSAVAEGGLHVHASTAVQVTEATLDVKIAAPDRLEATQDANIRVDAINPGPAGAVKVRLTQRVPEGFDLLTVSPGGTFDPSMRCVTWLFDTLPAGQRQIVTLTVRPKLAGTGKWEAVLTADRMAEARASHTINVEGSASLSMEMVARDSVVEVGGETILEVRVLNQGSAASSSVHFTVQTDEGLLLTRAEGPTNSQQGQSVAVFDPVPSLAAHGSAVFRLSIRGQQPGHWRIVAEIMAEKLTQPLKQEFIVRVR